jgi:hypothetical protein
MSSELRVYLQQTAWLLGQVEGILRGTPRDLLLVRPAVTTETNNLLASGKHAAAVTRAYALGIGCGLPVTRDRSSEFLAGEHEYEGILKNVTALSQELESAFESLAPARLDTTLMPEQSLYGTGTPREMTPREAIVENIRHLAIHLGEMRLTKSLLSSS